jgi:4-carboxymuconolactone decarboxylase
MASPLANAALLGENARHSRRRIRMPRIPYPDPQSLPESMRHIVNANPANVTRILARASEPVFNGFAMLSSAFTVNGSPLSPRLREIAILRVGYISDSSYEVFQHEALARHVGLSAAEIAAVKAGDADPEVLGEDGAAVLSFAEDLVHNIRASDETLAAVRKHLDDIQVTDLILVTGMYMMVCRLLETTGIEIDEDPIDWGQVQSADT